MPYFPKQLLNPFEPGPPNVSASWVSVQGPQFTLCNAQEILAPPPTYPCGKPFPLMGREILSVQSEIHCG